MDWSTFSLIVVVVVGDSQHCCWDSWSRRLLHVIQSQNNCHVHVVISENLSLTNFHIVFKILVLRPIRLSK